MLDKWEFFLQILDVILFLVLGFMEVDSLFKIVYFKSCSYVRFSIGIGNNYESVIKIVQDNCVC